MELYNSSHISDQNLNIYIIQNITPVVMETVNLSVACMSCVFGDVGFD